MARAQRLRSACGGRARRKTAREFWSKPVLTVLADGAVDEAVRPRVGARAGRTRWSPIVARRVGGAPAGSCCSHRGDLGGVAARARASPAGAPARSRRWCWPPSSQWALITRQAMTDMPFVSPMTIALCVRGARRSSARRRIRSRAAAHEHCDSACRVPRATAFWVFFALFAHLHAAAAHRLLVPADDGRQHPRLITCAPSASCRCCSYFAAYFVGALVVRARQQPPPALPLLGVRARAPWRRWPKGRPASRCRHRARRLARRRRPLARHLSQARDPARARALHRRPASRGTTRC